MSTLPVIKQVSGRAVPIPGDDVDTDRIIPARFMKCVTFDGLGEFAFYDVRFDGDGNKKKHPLNDERFDGASIMLVGSNFGCGSSREHAPQSLHKFGVRAIIGLSYAEIFFGNSTTLGIPCVCVDEKTLHTLTEIVETQPEKEISINIETKKISAGGNEFDLTMAESARGALLSAEWDALALLMKDQEEIEAVAEKLYGV